MRRSVMVNRPVNVTILLIKTMTVLNLVDNAYNLNEVIASDPSSRNHILDLEIVFVRLNE